jgi:GrpB-like predicted nucleotidyltransferase (UPF0157 family)
MSEIRIVEYQSSWVTDFSSVGAALRGALGDIALRIDHIGSTSVPGLAAKDIIDIQVTVADLDESSIGHAMQSTGAIERFKGTFDHEPPGQPIPDDQRQKWLWHMRGGGGPHANIHIRVDGRWNWRYALLCRDFLRAHAGTAQAYGEVKRQLARHFPNDVDAYYDVKDPAFDLFMSVAEEWAASMDWRPGPSDA